MFLDVGKQSRCWENDSGTRDGRGKASIGGIALNGATSIALI
ncbi:hypothetical protein [Mesorhizobium sp. AR10]|nr:hypothetical protein [Mesorhizobium sp. AR10]